jgi:uncharacterized membrane protein
MPPAIATQCVSRPKTNATYDGVMDHITFARFADQQHATEGMNSIRKSASSAQILMHWGAQDSASFDHEVQHTGESGETAVRHAMVLGAILGLLSGAAFGAVMSLMDLFPGNLVNGIEFGALMGVLVGLLMMTIMGSGLMDRRLKRLTRNLHAGEVVLTVRTKDRATQKLAHQALLQAGAEIAEKSVA